MAQPPFMILEVEHPPWMTDHHSELGFTPDEMMSNVHGGHHYRLWRNVPAAPRDFGSSMKYDEEKLQVDLNVQYFKPEEVSVKTIDGYIVVEAKHEEKRDIHGYVSRQFTRRYVLPGDCTPEAVNCRLSADGVLTIIAPRTVSHANQDERQIPIIQTGPFRN